MQESVEQKDQAEELTVEEIKQRTAKGALVLTFRTLILQAISFFSNILILPLFLNPEEYGVFFVVAAVINFLAYFSDIGFAASLIQKKEQLTKQELRTIFTAQQVLVFGIFVAVFLLTPVLKDIYKFDIRAVYLLWALAFSLVLSSLKTIPSVLLERKLEFNKLVIPQIIESLVFSFSVIYFAWQGYGVMSFTFGILLRGLSGLIVTYLIQPWMPAVSFSFTALKSVLKFGVPYQANSLLAMVKDDGMTIFLGAFLGTTGIGLLGWAQRWAYAPLRFFMDQVIKVTFPAFSRLQDNRQELSSMVSRSIFFICLLVFPSLLMLVFLSPSLIEIIPKYSKWSPALFALSILTITSALAAITTPLTNTLNAIGKITLTFKLMVMWTVLTWMIVPVLALLYGINGAAVGFTLVGFSSVIALYLVSKYIDINYLQSVGKPLLATILMGVFVFIVKDFLSVSLQQVIAMVVIGLVSYAVIIFALEPKLPVLIKNQFKKKS